MLDIMINLASVHYYAHAYLIVIAYAMETFTLDIGFWPTVYHNQFSCENCIQHGMIQLEKVVYRHSIDLQLI